MIAILLSLSFFPVTGAMDGIHRVCKALLNGFSEIEAVRFVQDPAPDYIGVHPDELPYRD